MFTRVHYIINIALLVLLTACGSDTHDTEVPEGMPIVFAPNTQDVSESTRATVGLGQDFVVCGYKMFSAGSPQYIMPRYAVTHSGGQYSYITPDQPVVYWDDKASEYRFWAYTGESDDGKTIKIENVEMQVEDPVTAFPMFSEIYIRKAPISYDVVSLQFKRPVAKVGVKFYNEAPIREGRTVNISHITLAPVADADAPKVNKIWNRGTVNVTYPDVTVAQPKETVVVTDLASPADNLEFLDVVLSSNHGDNVNNAVIALIPDEKTDFDLPDIPGVDPNSVQVSTGSRGRTRADGEQHPDHYYPLPMGDKNPDFVLKITLEGKERSVVIPEAFTHWQPNICYTYYIKVTNNGEALLSDAKIEGWTSGGSQEGDEFNNW